MVNNVSLQFVSFIYVLILTIVYFLKRKYSFMETKVYKFLLIDTLLVLGFDMLDFYITSGEIGGGLVGLIHELGFISFYVWTMLFVTYILLNISDKKYESFKDLLNANRKSRIFIIGISLLFVLLIGLQVLGDGKFFGIVNQDVQIIYWLLILVSFVLILLTLVKNKKLPSYKKWAVLVSNLLVLVLSIVQLVNNEIGIIETGISVITLFQYFTMENPDSKYIDELNSLKLKAEAANKAKTDFLASMSHEIRTPMNVILGLSEAMLNGDNIPKEMKGDIQNINDAGSILLEIVNNVLDITKIESGKMSINNAPYSLADMIAKLSHVTKISLMEKPITFDVNVSGNVPNTLMGDEVKLYQILMNILSNSVKYTKEGSIKLAVDSVIVGNKDVLTFKISDTGIGIRKSDYDKLFSEFERLDQEKSDIQGSGLGLVITKKLIDLLGGKISFESEYQRGTTFTIVIEQEIVDKAKIDFNTYEAKKVTVNKYFNGSGYKVLLVDDNLLNLKVAEKLLNKYNLNVTSVKSGLECLNITKNNKFDLVFLDHMMPEMDGIQTLYNLKNRAAGFDTPVVVLTANAINGSKQMYLNEGFADYLSKPIDQVELDRILREQLKINDDGPVDNAHNWNTQSVSNSLVSNRTETVQTDFRQNIINNMNLGGKIGSDDTTSNRQPNDEGNK